MSDRRPLWTVVGLLALASLLLWASSLMTWSWTQHSDPLAGVVTTKLTGSEREAALVPLALLSLALIAAVVATGGLVRRIAGGVVFLVGVWTVWLAFDGANEVFSTHPDAYPFATIAAGHGIAVLAGLAVTLAGVLLVRSGHRMPRLGAKYQAPSQARRVSDPDRELWQALDAGSDPTASQ
ncbi:Trp biosynthesis-associated membrane protein [Kutzneria kofuensis]|uniref:Putative membrane protein (TIGR02234 family) n=1 Tax=Kutzneria kofuensis TaxID=103725 RepID=A0A7W9KLA7_9PSEU|nr:Trp biosynthesis-associated membrane protein [Kutzneria kofuensis]MBB5894363.1 putative membrane protein (TIGR02234 family) [Kutzneria kofuensis]